tara:strand:+ start:223 stop:495 length:273 start_codon:yes stop_codon:yes gene_type:complete
MGLKSYKSLLRQQFTEEDYIDFSGFKRSMEKGFTDEDLKIVYTLHAKYFEHRYNEPCGCGGVKKMDTINRWIGDLEKVYDNGVQAKKLSE